MKTETDEVEGNADALIALLRRPQPWIRNNELAYALGLVNTSGNKAVMWHWADRDDVIGPDDTKLEGNARYYSKRAAILAGLRTRTEAANAFKLWVADSMVDWLADPSLVTLREKEAFAHTLAVSITQLLTGEVGDASE